MEFKVGITRDPLGRVELHHFLSHPHCGAENTFCGVVRETNQGQRVVSIEYDVFEPLAENILRAICKEALDEWTDLRRIFVMHRVGLITAGELSIAIGVAAPHRDEAFKACRFLIEQIKHRIPVWKRENYADSRSAWLPGCSLCHH